MKSALNPAPCIISIKGHQVLLYKQLDKCCVPLVKNSGSQINVEILHDFSQTPRGIEVLNTETLRSKKKIIFKKIRRHNYRRLKSCRTYSTSLALQYTEKK